MALQISCFETHNDVKIIAHAHLSAQRITPENVHVSMFFPLAGKPLAFWADKIPDMSKDLCKVVSKAVEEICSYNPQVPIACVQN